MENREILVANTRTQKKSKITTNATTLGELKTALDEANIDYSGMTFTEGISRTSLLDDAAQLPQNVVYKGKPTNNLVILLTNTKKNIASGAMSRKEVYQVIKDKELQNAVKEAFGKNYTVVSTSDLEDFIKDHSNSSDYEEEASFDEDYDDDYDEVTKAESLEGFIDGMETETLADSLAVNIAILYKDGFLSNTDLDRLKNNINGFLNMDANVKKVKAKKIKATPVSTSDGSITDSDVDDMIKDMVI